MLFRISTRLPGDERNLALLESEICNLLFNSDNPLRSTFIENIEFTSIPFPSVNLETGFVEVYGDFPDTLAEILTYSPYFKVKRGLYTLNLPGVNLCAEVENSYLSWLSSFRTKRSRKKVLFSRERAGEDICLFSAKKDI